MPRSKRSTQLKSKRNLNFRLKQHWNNKKDVYIRVLLVVVVLVVGILGAQFIVEKEDEHKGVVKALSGNPEDQYQQALTELREGEQEQGKIMMLRLARLGDTSGKPLGYGKAHLWVAEDILANFSPDFIWSFPLQGRQGEAEVVLSADSKITQAQKHLQHAAALNPELESAPLLLAATYMAQSERNLAIEVLLAAISHEQVLHPQFHIPLANIIPMKGDDLALKERAWYLFSSLGQDISSGRDLSMRIRYVLSALVLQKYENAEIVIRRLESQYSKSNTTSGGGDAQYRSVKALRMAYHYHRAVQRLSSINTESISGYEDVVDELAKVVRIQPDCKSAIAALSYIAAKDLSQKDRIKKILIEILESEGVENAHLKSRASLALAMNENSLGVARKEYLEAAIAADPENGEALLRLLEILVKADNPDCSRIAKLATKAMVGYQEGQRAECYYMLGFAELGLKNWNGAIVALEKSLAMQGDKSEVHRLLAEAYEAVGKTAIAASHRKMTTVK